MKDLKAELIDLIDRHQAKFNSATAAENESSNVAAQVESQTKADSELLSIIDKALAELDNANADESEDQNYSAQIDSGSEINLKTETQIVLPVEFPIYETTTRQLDYWHAFGSNLWLQMLLRQYQLDFSTYENRAFDEFRVGFDERRHVATFAIDETHYYIIQFNKTNSAPVNRDDADLVLKEIQRLQVLRDPTINFD